MPEITILLPMLALLLGIGAFVGVLAGLLGVGGGIVLVPAFFYAFSALGYSGEGLMQVCIATSLATIVVTSLRSVSSHNAKGAVDWSILRHWAPGIAAGAVLGVVIAAGLRSQALQVIFGALALGVGLYMLLGRDTWRLGQSMPTGLTRLILSPLIGFLSVLMGIGGGAFGVPTMTLYNQPIHRAVGTAAGFGLIIAVPAVIGFLMVTPANTVVPPYTLGAVNFVAFALIIAMTPVTTPLGVRLAHAMPPRPLKRAFAVFLILVALNMVRKALGW